MTCKYALSGIPPSNDMAKESTAEQQHSHSNSKHFYVSVRPHSPSHIPPVEMGMYIILATFSFAIVIFVVSCVVYASKYKPQSADFQDDLAGSSYLFGGGGGKSGSGYKLLSSGNRKEGGAKQISRLREPTSTNVQDWVWLGRATLERASGLLVPSISLNERKRRRNNDRIRITENPTYAPQPNPDTDLNTDADLENGSRDCRPHSDKTRKEVDAVSTNQSPRPFTTTRQK